MPWGWATLPAYFHSIHDVDLHTPDHHHLHSIEILSGYHVVNHPISSLRCLDRIQIIGMRRNGVNSDSPLSGTQLRAGDVLIIEGHPDDIQAAEIEIMSGL